jgi:hypothetical protein
MGPLPVIFKNCLGFAFRLTGQNRVPEPPAMITAYIIGYSEFVLDSKDGRFSAACRYVL